MSALPSMNYRTVTGHLRRHGFVFDRNAKGSHEIWLHPASRLRTTVLHHPGDIPRGTFRAIIRQSGLSVDEFMK